MSYKLMSKKVWLLVVTLMPFCIANGEEPYTRAKPDLTWLDQEALSMLPLEREKLANYLSAYVANHLMPSERHERILWSRRLLGLALTLHPENPRARQTNEALASSTPLPALENELDPEVLARLFYHRSRGLAKGKKADSTIALHFLAAAAYMAPYLEDVVFAHESRHLREGALIWTPISGQVIKTSTSPR